MAIFTQVAESKLLNGRLLDDKNDDRVADYLYELNENLTYMFNNLSPEDNYDEQSRLMYVQRGKQIASLELRADKIELRVADDERNYNTSMQLFANLLKLTANTPTGSSTIAMTGDKIELTTGKFIVNSTNLTIDALGNAVFSGTVEAAQVKSSTITGGTINGTVINGGNDIRFKARSGYLQFGDFVVDDSYGRHTFMSTDEVTGMSSGDALSGQLLLWAGWDTSQATFEVNNHGGVHINGRLYYNGTELIDLIESYSDSGGDEPDPDA
jgi:hypothetical protein